MLDNPQPIDLLLVPMLGMFFGLLVFFLGTKKELEGGKAIWKWVGVAIILVGAFTVWPNASMFLGIGEESMVELYRSNNTGRRQAMAHIASIVLPLLAVAACVIGHFVAQKRASRTA